MKKIESIKKEQDEDHIFWEAWTKKGYCFQDKGLHVWHEDTKKELLNSIELYLKQCNCHECSRQSK